MEPNDIARGACTMPDTTISVFHKVQPSERSFAQVIEALEAQLGQITGEQLAQFVQSSTSAEEFGQAMQPFIGPSGLMIFRQFDHGRWMSLVFQPLKAKLYLLGNPLFAKDMLAEDAAAGLYLPTRLCIYEDRQGVTQLAYDRLADFAHQFGNPALTSVAEAVDQHLGGSPGATEQTASVLTSRRRCATVCSVIVSLAPNLRARERTIHAAVSPWANALSRPPT